jgi:hypothetical protein
MTQTIVQGSEDPLLVLDHQGGSGNPTFSIQQDETPAAYIWWDQVNQVFNMGPASAGSPSLSIASDGIVSMGGAKLNELKVAAANIAGLETNQAHIAVLAADEANIPAANIAGLESNQAHIVVLAANQTNIDALETNQANIAALSAQQANIGTFGAQQANIGTLAAQQANIGTLAADHISGLTVAGQLALDGNVNVGGNVIAQGAVISPEFITASSKEIKENIANLSSQEALEVLGHLSPVKFNFKADNAKKEHIGFIAENVPQSVASSDGKGINLTNIVAMLTQVIKEQQKTIDALVAKSH